MAADDIAIDIIHVHDEAVANVKWAAGETFSKTYTEEMTEQVPEINRIPSSVDAAVDILESTDIEFTVHERSGNPAEEILKIADELDSDRIVLGVGGQSVVGKSVVRERRAGGDPEQRSAGDGRPRTSIRVIIGRRRTEHSPVVKISLVAPRAQYNRTSPVAVVSQGE